SRLPLPRRHAMYKGRKIRGGPRSFVRPQRFKIGIGASFRRVTRMRLEKLVGLLCAAAVAIVPVSGAVAQDKVVKIGAIFPMTGNAASAGIHARAAIEAALDIINNAHPELGKLPLAKNAGLAGLGGAKVEVVFGDNQGTPATGQNQALRLITE